MWSRTTTTTSPTVVQSPEPRTEPTRQAPDGGAKAQKHILCRPNASPKLRARGRHVVLWPPARANAFAFPSIPGLSNPALWELEWVSWDDLAVNQVGGMRQLAAATTTGQLLAFRASGEGPFQPAAAPPFGSAQWRVLLSAIWTGTPIFLSGPRAVPFGQQRRPRCCDWPRASCWLARSGRPEVEGRVSRRRAAGGEAASPPGSIVHSHRSTGGPSGGGGYRRGLYSVGCLTAPLAPEPHDGVGPCRRPSPLADRRSQTELN